MADIDLCDDLVQAAERYAAVLGRTVSEHIEYWVKIGKLAEENSPETREMILDFVKEE